MLNIFSGAFYHLCALFGKKKTHLFVSLALFLIRCLGGYFTVEFKSSLYILDTNPLLDV